MTREELNEMTDWNDDDEAVELWDAATAELNDDEDDEFDIFTTTNMVCAAKPAAKRGDDRGAEKKADAKQEEKKVARTITEDIKAALKPKKDSGKGI